MYELIHQAGRDMTEELIGSVKESAELKNILENEFLLYIFVFIW